MRKVLAIEAVARSKGDIYDGKHHDVILFAGKASEKDEEGFYRYSAPVKESEELTVIGKVVGGVDATGHYRTELLNKEPLTVSAELEVEHGYMWLRNPRIIQTA